MSRLPPRPPPPPPPPQPPGRRPPTEGPGRGGRHPTTLGRNPTLSSAAGKRPIPPGGHFAIGLEMELLFAARSPDLQSEDSIASFRALMARAYNANIDTRIYPEMVADISQLPNGDARRAKVWDLVLDPSVLTVNEPWGLEITSPIEYVFKGSFWRHDIAELWKFLNAHYRVTYNEKCSTHVHVSVDQGFQLPELKNIACAIIWFEAAIEALVPSIRRGNVFCKSNYLDNPNFARQRLTRLQAMERIIKCTSIAEVITLMCPGQGVEAKYYAWNFTAINKYNTIEFRKGAASVSEGLAFAWIELALRFVLISRQMGDMETLRQIPVNITSLKEYLSQEGEYAALQIFDDAPLALLFAGKKVPSVQPMPVNVETLSPADRQMLERKIKFDSEHNSILEKLASPPYFPAQPTAA